MPPRLVSLAIIVFWTTMTGWLLYREVWPRYRAGEPPPFSIDLTEEVSALPISWTIFQKGERAGTGQSQVLRMPDRTFELRSLFRFDAIDLKLPLLAGADEKPQVRKLMCAYHVTDAGRLLGLSSSVILGFPIDPKQFALDIELELHGEVSEGVLRLQPRGLLGGTEVKELASMLKLVGLGELQIPVRGSVLNPMHLLNRVPGLHLGQSWRVPLLDPGLSGASLAELEATVGQDLLSWHDGMVPCYKIEYREPGNKQEVRAATWVRQRDGLVLRQDAGFGGREFVIQRDPPKP